MWVKCVLVWNSQPLTSIFGLVYSSIKKIRLECRLHPSHSMWDCNNRKLRGCLHQYSKIINLSFYCHQIHLKKFPTQKILKKFFIAWWGSWGSWSCNQNSRSRFRSLTKSERLDQQSRRFIIKEVKIKIHLINFLIVELLGAFLLSGKYHNH